MDSRQMMFVVLALAVQMVTVCWGHVSLTYPPARGITFDFLDNARTPGPCGGQPKGEPMAEFREGDNITVTWHLAYPHRGGFRIELLPQNDSVSAAIRLLPAIGDWTGADDTTTLMADVKLPSGFVCDNCTIRFLRQAIEWGPTYQFWTCGDVRIINAASEFCSKHGTFANGACTCDNLYYGERCQYWDECNMNRDCQNGGMCLDTFAVSSPRKQCFCAAGFFGNKCQQVSAVKSLDNLDLSAHRKETLADDFDLYHKVIGDEVEMVIKAKTVSWTGIGWRPTSGAECKKQVSAAHSYPEGEGEPEGTAEGTAEPEGTAEGTAEPEGTAEGTAEPEAEGTAEPEAEGTAEPEGTAEGTAEPEGSAEPEGDGSSGTHDATNPIVIETDAAYLESQGLDPALASYQCVPTTSSGSGTAEGESEPEGTAEGTAEPEGSHGTAEPEVTAEGTAEPEVTAEGTAEPEGTAEGSHSTAEPEGGAEPEGAETQLHPMNCVDVILGSAHGTFSRIHDSFSKDRSTPKFDTYYGAKNSLTAAIGAETDGETTILIRRKLAADDEYDWPITDDNMVVIWARGQKHLHYTHNAVNGIDVCTVKDYFFYRNDVPMYHGHTGQRGVTQVNFVTAAEVSVTSSAYSRDANNAVSWVVEGDNVVFTVKAEVASGEWFAVGLSENRQMAATDVLHIGVDPSTSLPVFTDRYASGYSPPGVDATEDETSFSADYTNGVVTATITRPANTGDDTEDMDLNKCLYVFLVNGVNYNGNSFSKHAAGSPTISTDCYTFMGQTSEPAGSGHAITYSLSLLLSAVFALLL